MAVQLRRSVSALQPTNDSFYSQSESRRNFEFDLDMTHPLELDRINTTTGRYVICDKSLTAVFCL